MPKVPVSFQMSYNQMRITIGCIGLFMPLFVCLGAYFFEGIPLLDSISAYYYTKMRDIFVGILFIVGVFLIFYSAYDDKIDNWITNFAGLFAICIGVFPMDPSYHPNVLNDSINILGSQCYQNHGPLGFHMLAASAFFVLIGILTIFRFTKSNDSNRNYVYILCGSVMLISIVWIFFAKLHEQSASIFWPETFAIISFTAAWLIKGGAYATINNGSRVLLKRLF